MSGIVGCIGKKDVPGILLQGLSRLEFLGYDSAGLAVNSREGIRGEKLVGAVRLLASRIGRSDFKGRAGIAGLRYATSGEPTKANAHPQYGCQETVAVVHHGMIEDHERVKRRLVAEGHRFRSQTDTEVIAHLLESESSTSFIEGFIEVLKQVAGSFSFLALDAKKDNALFGACRESSLFVGVGNGFHIVSSEYTPIIAHTREILEVCSGEVVRIFPGRCEIFTQDGRAVQREPRTLKWTLAEAQRQGHDSFSLKEINEQPLAIRRALSNRIGPSGVRFGNLGITLKEISQIRHVQLIGSGSSYHAAQAGKALIEEIGRVPASSTVASGLIGFDSVVDEQTLLVSVSRSGFTRDTIRAARDWKRRAGRILVLCNAMKSPLWEMGDARLDIMAGPEIGIATTKSFTNQLTTLVLLAAFLGRTHKQLTRVPERELLWGLRKIPDQVHAILAGREEIDRVARTLKGARSLFFTGIGFNYPTALEGALKMKQFAAVHAEGISVGEIKHQALTLLGRRRPVVALAIQGRGYVPMVEGIQEVKACGGSVIAIATEGDSKIGDLADEVLYVPRCAEVLSPLLAAIPVQLLAAYFGAAKGLNIDEPRNLVRFFPEKENNNF
jgi:glucosamine--fructose-6-phosphate aminotransferase (isomerizing)